MKTYTTQLLPGLTMDAIATQQNAALAFANHLFQASKNGWEFEQAIDVSGGVLVVLSHAAFAAGGS